MSKPLWEVMHASSRGVRLSHCRTATEIRAVAEWIERRQVEDYATVIPDVSEVIEWLRTEADRAERS